MGGGGAELPLMLPTIVGWIVQWNVRAFVLVTARVLLVAPGVMSPESHVPLFATRWCMVPSLFLNATDWPDAAGAGLGENEALPTEPEMATVTLAPEVDPVLGGVVAAGEGVVGVEYAPPPPQPTAHSAAAARMMAMTA